MALWGFLLVLLAAFGLLVFWPDRRPETPGDGGPTAEDQTNEDLEAAERELTELDATVTPDEADDQLPDWGPGVPKPPPS